MYFSFASALGISKKVGTTTNEEAVFHTAEANPLKGLTAQKVCTQSTKWNQQSSDHSVGPLLIPVEVASDVLEMHFIEYLLIRLEF